MARISESMIQRAHSSHSQVLREGVQKALNFLHDSFFIEQISMSVGSLGEGALQSYGGQQSWVGWHTAHPDTADPEFKGQAKRKSLRWGWSAAVLARGARGHGILLAPLVFC